MPEIAVNRGTKMRGLKTFSDASRLCPELRQAELEYVDIRNYYVNQLALLAQFEEELKYQKRIGDKERMSDLGNKISAIQAHIQDMRDRVRLAGERSWSEAFVLAARHMLPKEILTKINIAADSLIGRETHELRPKSK